MAVTKGRKMANGTAGITILHLSDIHRTEDEPVSVDNILSALRADLHRQQEDEGFSRPDFLVISGNLTQSAQPAEYDETYRLVDALRMELTVPEMRRVILAPGDGSAWIDQPRGSVRMVRGGSWNFDASCCRLAYRSFIRPGYRGSLVGFRLSRSVVLGP